MGKVAVLFLGIVLPVITWARGPGISGGGTGVVCRDSQQQIISVELLDLWEVREIEGGKIKYSSASAGEQVAAGIRALASTYRPLGAGLKGNLEFAANMFLKRAANVRWLRGKVLEDTEDVLPPVRPDPATGCKLEPIVNFLNNPGEIKILVNADLYDKLNETNRAALILHEAFYYSLRDFLAEKTSTRTRRMIGHLFTTGLRESTTKYIPASNYIVCHSKPTLGQLSRVYLYERERDIAGSNKRGITVFPEYIGGIAFLEPNGVGFTHDVYVSDFRKPGFKFHGIIYVSSRVDPEWSDEYWFETDNDGKMSLTVALLNSAATPNLPFKDTLDCEYVP